MEIKSAGSKVKINQILDVDITDYTRYTDLTFQQLVDASQYLEITKEKAFAFELDDVDKAQMKGEVMEEAMRRAALALANLADTFVYAEYANAATQITQGSLTSANIISTITQAGRALDEADVPDGMERFLEVSPKVWEKMVLAKIVKDYGNSNTLQDAKVNEYLGFKIFKSNNIYQNGSLSECIARTKDAITFAEQINDVESGRTEKGFRDYVKGLHVYGLKTVRPKELIRLTLTVASESTI